MRLFQNKIAKKSCQSGLLFAAALLSVCGILHISENNAYAVKAANTETTIYQQGDMYTPEENVQIKVDEDTFVAATKGIIKFPDGTAYELGARRLKQCGVYEIAYYGEHNGEKVSSYEKVVVTDASGKVDTTAPTMTVVGLKANQTSFNVVLNKEISIKDVEITDSTYYGNLKTAVYFNYGTATQSSVYVENGKFTPTQAGKYTLVYTATDGYGNVGEKALHYTAKANLTNTLTYTEPEALQNLVACQKYELARLSVKGNNTTPQSEIVITDPLGETATFKNRKAEFTPNVLGEYTISYRLWDTVYEETFSYTVFCEDANNAVVFQDLITLPRYFIKDATYSIDKYLAYKPTAEGLTGYETEVYVKADAAEEYTKIENLAAYKITASESLQFKYVLGEEFIESEVVPVQTNVGYGTQEVDYLKYFLGDFVSAEAAIDAFVFTFDGEQSTGKMRFINPIAFSSFNFAFRIVEEYGNFEKLEFILTDYANPANVNKVLFKKVDGGFALSVNGASAVTITSRAFAGEAFGFWVNSGEQAFRTNFNKDDGSALKFNCNAFESYLCHLEIQVSGMEGESKIAISKINNQGLQDGLVLQNPETSAKIFKGAVVVGSEVPVNPMQFSSVFHPVLTEKGRVTVTDPTGKIVTAVDGTVLDNVIADKEFRVVLSMAGSYLVKYTAEFEANGVIYKRTSNGALNAYDNVAPTVTFDNGANENSVVELEVGDLHTVFKYKATDNLTDGKKLQTTMMVYNEDGWVCRVLETEVVFYEAGTYKVVIYAVDDDGNVGKNSYTVVVR